MKKQLAFFALLLLFSALLAGSAQAVSMYLWWPDGSTNLETFDAGDDIVFNYTGIGPSSHPIETEIYWANLDNPSQSDLLIQNISNGGTWGQESFSTNGFEEGSYVIFGVAADLTTAYEDEDYLYFDLIGEPNNAPEFTDDLTLYYEYNIDLVNVDVVDLANYAFDLDNDNLVFSVDESGTNNAIIDCSIISDSILNCDLEGVGSTSVDVVVSDGQSSDTATITIDVFETSQNNPPEFTDDLILYYEYNIDLVNVDVVDLADYSFDLDNDDLYFYVSEANTNLNIIDCDIVSDSLLNCDLEGVGITTVDVVVSDGQSSDTATITINVFEDGPVNHPPEFTDDLELYYEYNIDLSNVDVVDLADYAFDLDNDDLYFYVNQANTNNGIVDCQIISDSILNCNLEGVGTTSVDVIVSDTVETDTAAITINVFEDGPVNHPPEFTDDLELYYSYNISLSNVDVVDLADYAFDLDGDELSFYVDESNTDFGVVDCQVIDPSKSTSQPDPYDFGSVLNCDLVGVGITSVDVIVSDGQAIDTATIAINVFEDDQPNNPPEFTDDLELYYEYHIDLSNVDVVDLALFSFDLDNDELSFYVDESNTNLGVVDCQVIDPSGKTSLPDPNDFGSVLNCDLNGVGITSVDVVVSDGQAIDTATITIRVFDDQPNNPPEFTDDLTLYYEYNIDLVNIDVVDLADYAFDLDNDDLDFFVDESNTNFGVVDCDILSDSVLNCDLVGVGITSVDVVVSDGQEIDTATITINVYEDQPQNTAPYFNNLALFHSYSLDEDYVVVSSLSQYAYDDEFDTVTFSLDESNTDINVLNCSLINSSVIGVPPTPFEDPSLLVCNLNGVGITTIDVGVSDDEFTTWETITLEVYENQGNQPPYFDGLQQYYSYNIDLGNVDLVNIEDFSADPDGDELTYLLDESNTDLSIADCDLIQGGSLNSPESVLNCDLNGVGTTSVDVGISDGYYTVWATITIHVYELGGENTAPYFTSNMQTYYSLNIDNTPANIVDLSLFAYDNEFDTVKFDIDQSNTNLNIANCHLEESNSGGFPPTPFIGPNLVVCDLNSVGTTSIRVVVSDGELSSYVDITINVYSTNPTNTAPYFGEDLNGNNMGLSYSYDFDLVTQTDVINLASFANDAEGDLVKFGLDQSNTDLSVTTCSLNDGVSVPSPTPYLDPSILNCVFNGIGTTTVDVIISDGSLSSKATITINVFQEQSLAPVAIISSPGTSGFEGELKIVNGSKSYSPSGLDIVDYQWSITDIYGNSIYSTNGVSSFPFTFSKGTYFIALTVVDSNGESDSTTKTYKVYEDSSADDGVEQGLKIVTYDVYGYDFERVRLGGDLVISAWLENQAGVDLDGVRMTYALPEFGIRYTSSSVSIESGEREHILIHAQVPCCDLDPGVYYPYISFSDGDIRRVKAGYLEVYP